MSILYNRNDYDEINEIGTINFNGCKPIAPAGIEITVSEAWDDSTPRRQIMMTCHGGSTGTEYTMDVDKAEALGHLLLSASRQMREMVAHLEAEAD